ncbi:unnamed protein product [Blumeria hordei]|uniref:Uncharacterized protein n=1 Tax=Blumeria hordei TaxID=2867405 RepID=A0A383UT14_BLUHO|nr:unnamed protein product [Blumeria hordei]
MLIFKLLVKKYLLKQVGTLVKILGWNMLRRKPLELLFRDKACSSKYVKSISKKLMGRELTSSPKYSHYSNSYLQVSRLYYRLH